LEAINNDIEKQEVEIKQKKEKLKKAEEFLKDRKEEVKNSADSLAKGANLKTKRVAVKKLQDGIIMKMGKDGIKRYFDKNGKEVKEEDAFKEVFVEVPDDGDTGAE